MIIILFERKKKSQPLNDPIDPEWPAFRLVSWSSHFATNKINQPSQLGRAQQVWRLAIYMKATHGILRKGSTTLWRTPTHNHIDVVTIRTLLAVLSQKTPRKTETKDQMKKSLIITGCKEEKRKWKTGSDKVPHTYLGYRN